jgi:signal transduction histidine kinase
MSTDNHTIEGGPGRHENPEKFYRDIEIEFLIHELKDPISIIETGMRTLLEKQAKFGPLSARQERTLKRVLRNTQKARGMLYNLLEIGRSESGCFEACAFRPGKAVFEVLLDALAMTASQIYEQIDHDTEPGALVEFLKSKGIELDITPQVTDCEILQDETKFRQIAGNLIKNALHHRSKTMAIRLDLMRDQLILEVIDDGPGVDPEDHEKIFRRYAQVKTCALTPRNGHGLGLAGARIIARCLGGDIELFSRQGQGATFRLKMPTNLNTASPFEA